MIENLKSMHTDLADSDRGVCAKCKGEFGGELTKITDIKTQILARTKFSLSKHLKAANVRDE